MFSMYNFGFLIIFVVGMGMLLFLIVQAINRISKNAFFILLLQKSIENQKKVFFQNKTPSYKSIKFYEVSKLVGWAKNISWQGFVTIRIFVAVLAVSLVLLSRIPYLEHMNWIDVIKMLITVVLVGFVFYMLPFIMLKVEAKKTRSEYLMEISLFAERLALCVTDKVEVREIILRAGRPLKHLYPHIQVLAEKWQVNQQEAIRFFQNSVGVSEVFTLVNALENISKANPKDIVQVLKDQAGSIESTLESDVNRAIENAPISLTFYIMIPFLIGMLIFLYPWVVQVSDLLNTSF